MTNQNDRFTCILEPCGLWLVWDEARRAPAELPGLGMAGLSEAAARRRCRFLNRRSLRSMSPWKQRPPFGSGEQHTPWQAPRLKLR